VEEGEGVLEQLRVRGWTPAVVFWDQPALWSAAASLELVDNTRASASEEIRYLFSPCPFLEEQAARIEAALLSVNATITNPSNVSIPLWLCDVGCGSGRDVAWMLARTGQQQQQQEQQLLSTDMSNSCKQQQDRSVSFHWNACAIDAWQGAVTRTGQLLASRCFTPERAHIVRAQFQPDGLIRYYDHPSGQSPDDRGQVNIATTPAGQSESLSTYEVRDKSLAKQLLEHRQYDLVVAVRFLERAAFPHLDRCVRPGGFLLYSTFVDGICEYEQPAGQSHRLAVGELAAYFTTTRGYAVLEDRIDWTDDGRPLSSFLAQKSIVFANDK
jgi:2-polyprenyl-3-methyl-5-hydroxy-6-metoxy-1,4-benzoquinol methylase